VASANLAMFATLVARTVTCVAVGRPGGAVKSPCSVMEPCSAPPLSMLHCTCRLLAPVTVALNCSEPSSMTDWPSGSMVTVGFGVSAGASRRGRWG
jgi:hypothetical protein